MTDETEWPIQTWSRRYDHFLIEVRRKTRRREVDGDPYERRGPYLWTVYAYIYPSHWHFAAFDGDKHWQPATDDMPLHGGCTFLEYHWRQGETGLVVSAVQVGCDYNHLHDERHTHDAEGFTPFRDTVALANWLMIREVPADDPGGARGGEVMAKIHDLTERQHYGYWEIRVYHGHQQIPVKAWQVRGKNDAREQYDLAVKHASRDAAFPVWRVVLVYCVVTETAYEQDGTGY